MDRLSVLGELLRIEEFNANIRKEASGFGGASFFQVAYS